MSAWWLHGGVVPGDGMSDEPTARDPRDDLPGDIAWRVAPVSGWPEWMQGPALGRDITPVVQRVIEALAAAGLSITATPDTTVDAVRALHVRALEYDEDDSDQFCVVCRTRYPCATARACGVPDVD